MGAKPPPQTTLSEAPRQTSGHVDLAVGGRGELDVPVVVAPHDQDLARSKHRGRVEVASLLQGVGLVGQEQQVDELHGLLGDDQSPLVVVFDPADWYEIDTVMDLRAAERLPMLRRTSLIGPVLPRDPGSGLRAS